MLVISSLEYGGAERQVLALARHLDPARFEVHVCSMSSANALAEGMCGDIRLHLLPKRARFDVTVVGRLAILLRRLGVDLVHSFLLDADIACRLAGRLGGVRAVIGSERNSNYLRPLRHRVALGLTKRMCNAIVANSHAGKDFTLRTLQVPLGSVHVVHNGVDTERFQPRPQDPGLRRSLGIPPNAPVVGMVANFKRQKNYEMFLQVAGRVAQFNPETRFLCVGDAAHERGTGMGAYRREIHALARGLDLEGRCVWLDARRDIAAIYNMLTVSLLTSRREGTPNVLLEAMASGVPSVVTDVADNSIHVEHGVSGFVVPLDAVEEMSDHVRRLISEQPLRAGVGAAARRRVCDAYSLAAMARSMGAIYQNVLAEGEHSEAAGRRPKDRP
jgi:glycosyltransferase involved in cell wall biosynthesis